MNCKIIATSCAPRTRRGNPITYPDHIQHLEGVDDTKRMLQDLVDFEMRNDPGCPLDIIIVNNSIGDKDFDKWVDTLAGETRWGKIKVLANDNIGWSFGAYDEAYQVLKNDYHYWLFTEDDIFVGGNNYYSRLIEKFNEDNWTGFVALVQVVNHTYGKHCGGGVGLTSSKVLEKLNKRLGYLPHHIEEDDSKLSPAEIKAKIIQEGEVPFTNEILKMGYDLIPFEQQDSWNMERNLCSPYYNLYG